MRVPGNVMRVLGNMMRVLGNMMRVLGNMIDSARVYESVVGVQQQCCRSMTIFLEEYNDGVKGVQ